MLNRIQRIIDYYKLTSSAFADKIGVPRSTISHILSGRNNPSLDFVMKTLASFPQVNTEWLLNGIGPMLKVNVSLFPDEKYEESKDFEASIKESDEPEYGEEVTKSRASVGSLQFEQAVREPGQKSIIIEEKWEEPPTIVRSEDPPEYNPASKRNIHKASKVMVLYDDGTFVEYNPRLTGLNSRTW